MATQLHRARQHKLLTVLDNKQIDAALLTSHRSIYYFTGILSDGRYPQALVLVSNGQSSLVTPLNTADAQVDHCYTYENYSLNRVLGTEQIHAGAARSLADILSTISARKVAIEPEHLSYKTYTMLKQHWPEAEFTSTTADVLELRRSKSPDEIARIRGVVKLLEAGYAAVRGEIRAELTECDVFNVFSSAVIRQAGGPIVVTGDFGCGTRAPQGGGPSACTIEPGDLFIIDAFPNYRGYHADLCRTFAVAEPTAAQQTAWSALKDVLLVVESMIRPGMRTAEIYHAVQQQLGQFSPKYSFPHHAGHGIGMEAQEFPWITPGSDQYLIVGDVIALEPGLYGEDLRGGIRLEQNYVVKENGFERLSSFPLELV